MLQLDAKIDLSAPSGFPGFLGVDEYKVRMVWVKRRAIDAWHPTHVLVVMCALVPLGKVGNDLR